MKSVQPPETLRFLHSLAILDYKDVAEDAAGSLRLLRVQARVSASSQYKAQGYRVLLKRLGKRVGPREIPTPLRSQPAREPSPNADAVGILVLDAVIREDTHTNLLNCCW